MKWLLAGAIAFLSAAPAGAATFDCAQASQPADFVLCSDANGLKAAETHAVAWKQLIAALDEIGRKNLVAQQKQWNRSITSLCDLPDHGRPSEAVIAEARPCIINSFLKRAQSLDLIEASLTASPEESYTLENWRFPPYQVSLITDKEEDAAFPTSSLVSVMKDGHWIYSTDDALIQINPSWFFDRSTQAQGSPTPYQIGGDVLGLGAPTLMLSGFSLGAHCCFDLTILMLGDEFRVVKHMDLFDNEVVKVVKPPSGPATLELDDFSYDYWQSSFADSPAPRVILSYDAKAGTYLADSNLMRAPLPDLASLIRDAKTEQNTTGVSRKISEPVLDLIYSGHFTEAHDFLTKAWTGPEKDRDAYWTALTTCRMRTSQFWPAVAALNELPADKPVGKCP